MNIKVASADELVKFLRLYGFDDEEGIREIYENMPEPISVSKDTEDHILQIAHVWEKDNTRYVLWNDSSIDIHIPEYPTYKYMDAGRYKYGGVIFLFESIDERLKINLKRYWRDIRHLFCTYHEFMNTSVRDSYGRESFTVKPHEFYYAIDIRDKNLGIYPPEYVKKWLECTIEPLKKKWENIRLTRDSVYIGGHRYGLEGIELVKYLCPSSHLDIDGRPLRHPDSPDVILQAFYRGMDGFFTPGEYVLHLGSFSVPFNVKKVNGRTYRLLCNTKIRKDEFKTVLQCAGELDKDRFFELLKKLKHESLYSLYIKKHGISLPTGDGVSSSLTIKLKVEKQKRKWYVFCPMDGKRFVIPQGIGKIKRLHKLTALYYLPYLTQLFDVYKVLSEFIPEKHVMHIIENARKKAREAVEKSVKLLNDTLEKYKDRIIEQRVEFGDGESLNGYLVKGRRRNYFVAKSSLDTYTYPSLEHICIVEKGYRRGLPVYDRLVNRLLLLLNDEDLEGQISTMQELDCPDELFVMV